MGVDQVAAVGQRRASSGLGTGPVKPAVGPRQRDVAGRQRLALDVVVLQRDLGAVLVAQLQVVAAALGDHVVEQLLIAALALDDAVALARLGLELVGLSCLQGLLGFTVVQGEGRVLGHGLGSGCTARQATPSVPAQCVAQASRTDRGRVPARGGKPGESLKRLFYVKALNRYFDSFQGARPAQQRIRSAGQTAQGTAIADNHP